MLQQGVLMGDPLTKVCLHLVNILVRKVGEKYASPDFLKKVFPLKEIEVKEYIDKYCQDPVPPEFTMNLERAYVPIQAEPSTGTKGPPAPMFTFETVENNHDGDTESHPVPRVFKRVASQAIKQEGKAPIGAKPKAEQPKPPTRKPLGFTLTTDWLKTPKQFNVVNSNGSIVKAHLNACRLTMPSAPAEARQFTFRCVQLKNTLIASEENRIRTSFVDADNARRIAIQEGFSFNIPKIAAAPRITRADSYGTPLREQRTYVQARRKSAYKAESSGGTSTDSDLEYCTESTCVIS